MRLLIQRVSKAKVTTSQKIAKINKGLVVFVGFHLQDTPLVVDKMIQKFFNIHYFSSEDHKAKYTIEQQQVAILLISQFTLFADVKKGRTPSWHRAATGDNAKKLYDLCYKKMIACYSKVKTGVFGAYMEVELINDGPFTLLLDSKELFPSADFR